MTPEIRAELFAPIPTAQQTGYETQSDQALIEWARQQQDKIDYEAFKAKCNYYPGKPAVAKSPVRSSNWGTRRWSKCIGRVNVFAQEYEGPQWGFRKLYTARVLDLGKWAIGFSVKQSWER